MKNSDTLTVLENFKIHRQSFGWSCGMSCALMVLEWYGKIGGYDELSLAEFRKPSAFNPVKFPGGVKPSATSLRQLIDVFESVGGFDLYSTFDCKDNVAEVFTLEFVKKTLKRGIPIMIGWKDREVHWQVIIGYDSAGAGETNNGLIIVADPYDDEANRYRDGYGAYDAEHFINNFTFGGFFAAEDLNEMCFLVAVPKQT